MRGSNDGNLSQREWHQMMNAFDSADRPDSLVKLGTALLDSAKTQNRREYALSQFQRALEKEPKFYDIFKSNKKITEDDKKHFFRSFYLKDFFKNDLLQKGFLTEHTSDDQGDYFYFLAGDFSVCLVMYDFPRYGIRLNHYEDEEKKKADFYFELMGRNSGEYAGLSPDLGLVVVKKGMEVWKSLDVREVPKFFTKFFGDDFPCPYIINNSTFDFIPAEDFIVNSIDFLVAEAERQGMQKMVTRPGSNSTFFKKVKDYFGF